MVALNAADARSGFLLIGIDDTDNLATRGTGFRARCLGTELARLGFGKVAGITRHQLLLDEAIPYTTHNSSACLSLQLADGAGQSEVAAACRAYLLHEAAAGSDTGLCIAAAEKAAALVDLGRAAKTQVLEPEAVAASARERHIYLQGLTGDHSGIIGAAAAVGLHASGEDGRYIWLRRIRELAGQVLCLADLQEATGLDGALTIRGEPLGDPRTRIDLGDWPRAVRRGGRAILLVEKSDDKDGGWRVARKDIIRTC